METDNKLEKISHIYVNAKTALKKTATNDYILATKNHDSELPH